MPLCGFDEQMLDGLSEFNKGLAKSIERKSLEHEISVDAAIHLELKELGLFILHLEELVEHSDCAYAKGLLGLAYFAEAYYQTTLQALENHPDSSAGQQFKQTNDEERAFLFEVDRLYEQDLKGTVTDPIKEIVLWVAQHGKEYFKHYKEEK